MPIELFNTLTSRKEPFQPDGDAVSMYVCGLTPKNHPHIGHAWLFGPKRNASVNLGFGLTRLFGKDADGYGAPSVLPNVRLANIGIAF